MTIRTVGRDGSLRAGFPKAPRNVYAPVPRNVPRRRLEQYVTLCPPNVTREKLYREIKGAVPSLFQPLVMMVVDYVFDPEDAFLESFHRLQDRVREWFPLCTPECRLWGLFCETLLEEETKSVEECYRITVREYDPVAELHHERKHPSAELLTRVTRQAYVYDMHAWGTNAHRLMYHLEEGIITVGTHPDHPGLEHYRSHGGNCITLAVDESADQTATVIIAYAGSIGKLARCDHCVEIDDIPEEWREARANHEVRTPLTVVRRSERLALWERRWKLFDYPRDEFDEQ